MLRSTVVLGRVQGSLLRPDRSLPAVSSVRGFAEKKSVPQPPKEQVQQRLQDVKAYKESMRELRRDLVAQGVSKLSIEVLREQRVAEGRQRVGRKYTKEEKQDKLKAGKDKHEAYMVNFKKVFHLEEKKRIMRETIRRKKGEAFRESMLSKAAQELAADIEHTWRKPVRDDLKLIVPVNAPFLGVLPKHHAEVAPIFGDDMYKIRQMYGPPKPLPPAEDQYNGIDPRIVSYTSERRPSPSSSPDWKQAQFSRRFGDSRPASRSETPNPSSGRGNDSGNANQPPSSSS